MMRRLCCLSARRWRPRRRQMVARTSWGRGHAPPPAPPVRGWACRARRAPSCLPRPQLATLTARPRRLQRAAPVRRRQQQQQRQQRGRKHRRHPPGCALLTTVVTRPPPWHRCPCLRRWRPAARRWRTTSRCPPSQTCYLSACHSLCRCAWRRAPAAGRCSPSLPRRTTALGCCRPTTALVTRWWRGCAPAATPCPPHTPSLLPRHLPCRCHGGPPRHRRLLPRQPMPARAAQTPWTARQRLLQMAQHRRMRPRRRVTLMSLCCCVPPRRCTQTRRRGRRWHSLLTPRRAPRCWWWMAPWRRRRHLTPRRAPHAPRRRAPRRAPPSLTRPCLPWWAWTWSTT